MKKDNKNIVMRQVIAGILCMLFLANCVCMNVHAEEKVIRSNVDYSVTLRDASLVFIGNETAVDWNVGDKYFLTYTVENVSKNENFQSGMVATSDQKASHPYTAGSMQYSQEMMLCEEGYTYFFRFEVTKDGWKYVAAKAKGEESTYLQFPHTEGTVNTKTPYFGIWLGEGEGVTVDLTHVRCYDERGTDLGIFAPLASSITISEMRTIEDVNHAYNFAVENVPCFAFGSAKKADVDVFFLEYSIENVKAKGVNQSGAIMTNAPTDLYPFAEKSGYLNYTPHDEKNSSKLITEGARYLVRFERGEEKFDVLVKCTTKDGKEEYFAFAYYYGTYRNDLEYVAIWIGEACSLTANFVDVKCYDGEGNNLGIQTNKNVPIAHFGELEDYSKCEAVYYCEANDTFIVLDDEKNATKRVDGESTAIQGTYSIEKAVMELNIGEQKEVFNYYYDSFVDQGGNRYYRLGETEVSFRSRFMGGTVIDTVKVTAADGYKVKEPVAPTEKGRTFVCWVDGKEQKYDFDRVVMENTDLYATWEGDNVWELTNVLGFSSDVASLVVVIALGVVIIGFTALGVYFINRRENNGREKKEKGK